ncbi:hypothetical protein E2C01_013610 [Portunus trituberculatus]|uniref:Uncharacterized protein n=1 Tax=Portunus trituberculatus TaxID=210409 RepID=A0A5B7DHK7_PORTR|nr:hypothetical protein [Portunus trituberculatus]
MAKCSRLYVVGFEPTRGRLPDPTLTTLSTTPPPVCVCVFVCLFVCLFVFLFVCLFVCLNEIFLQIISQSYDFIHLL